MLQITRLCASLGRRPILHDITLTAQPGQVLAICGPNGAGKSTLLRAALGELPVTGGAVTLNGLDPRSTRPDRMARLRAVLPQDTQVAFAFTAAQIVAMGRDGGDSASLPDLVTHALQAVGLHSHADQDFQTLSGGEKQRVHLARALAQVWQPTGPAGPRWLFLDEPVASLDLGHQLLVMQLARRYADAGGGVVAVMHDLNLSAMFADHIALMIDGRLHHCAPPAVVLTEANLHQAYGCRIRLNTAPPAGPWFVPQSAELAAP